MESLFELLREHFARHGYWTVGIALLLENAGIPVPGETILLFASFLAYSEGQLHLFPIIVVATIAATVGDNIGYWIGRRGGRPLLDRYKRVFRISDRVILRGEQLFQKRGAPTIFFARFIFGMRIVAGPLAGVLCMPWRQFAFFNFAGAAVWVTVISLIGYIFGENWERLLRVMHHVNLGVAAVVAAIALFLWWRYHRRVSRSNGSNGKS